MLVKGLLTTLLATCPMSCMANRSADNLFGEKPQAMFREKYTSLTRNPFHGSRPKSDERSKVSGSFSRSENKREGVSDEFKRWRLTEKFKEWKKSTYKPASLGNLISGIFLKLFRSGYYL